MTVATVKPKMSMLQPPPAGASLAPHERRNPEPRVSPLANDELKHNSALETDLLGDTGSDDDQVSNPGSDSTEYAPDGADAERLLNLPDEAKPPQSVGVSGIDSAMA
jgi:hypothetical protein